MLALLKATALALLLLGAHAQVTEPQLQPAIELTGRVTDAADILSESEEDEITAKLSRLELETGHQFVVTSVQSLGGRDVADYTKDLGNSWGIGREGVDDGLILLIAPNERKVRIEVGIGLEQALPNEFCQEVLERLVIPRFREGDLPGGVEAAVDALIVHLIDNRQR